jgi:Kef-type K+ transport system membrane component KefB/mannitol/fructose-specific phosphotransferase system IIA component (Ntr-type)/nucleotide-binding universal stress UspA family protein
MIIFLVAPLLAVRFRVPGIIGLIVAGAVVGPHGLGLLARDATVILLGTVGLLYLVFLAGLELDLHRFVQFRRRSIIFGFISFTVPLLLAVIVMPMLGFGMAASLLMGSIIGSHTLLAYPVVSRLGLVKNDAVTMVVGGTLVTDTLALGLLAVIAGSLGGDIGLGFWVKLLGGLAIYVALVYFGVPRIGRWFFRNTPGQPGSEFIFLMVVLFASAWLADLAGAQPIIGAFLAGLTLNRLIPNEGPHMTRARFVGNALFIPFFLLSVGMLVDPRVLVGSGRVWILAITITLLVHLGKLAGALIPQRLFGFSRSEGLVSFGLSLPQAAATLAVTFVGLEIGLFDEEVVNAVVVMILITGLVGPSLVERFGQAVALEEEGKPFDPADAPQRILVPMANPATADDLMDLALILRDPHSREPIHPTTVVPADNDRSDQYVALAEKMLSHAVAYATAADAPVVPLTRMDHNFASGISRAATETRSSVVIIGWDGKRAPRRGVFGSVLDQLLEHTRQQVLVAKLGHPLNTTRRIVLVIPPATDHQIGFLESAQSVKRMANRLGARIDGYAFGSDADLYSGHLGRVSPEAPLAFRSIGGWGELLASLREELRPDDLAVVISARRGSVSWSPALERLPGLLSTLVPESFIMMYPSEVVPSSNRQRFTDGSMHGAPLPASRVLIIPPEQSYEEALEQMLGEAFADDPERARAIRQLVLRNSGPTSEIRPGVVVPHARLAGLDQPILFLGLSREGMEFPGATAPARLIFLLLTREDRPEEHLANLAAVARTVSDPERLAQMAAAEDAEALMESARIG